jgi:hypothetical protein
VTFDREPQEGEMSPILSDEAWEEQQQQRDEGMGRQGASLRATVAAQVSQFGVLKAQVAGLLNEFEAAVGRIDLIEAACFRRLDRIESQIEPWVDRAPSTGTPAL